MNPKSLHERRDKADRRVHDITVQTGQIERRRNPERRSPEVFQMDIDEDIKVTSKTESVLLALTGHAEIDQQHAELVRYLDEFQEHVGGRYDVAASLSTLAALFEFANKHFAFEEELLAKLHFPHLDEHIEEHRAMSAEFSEIWKEAEIGNDIGEKLLQLIRKWILEHINSEDAQFASLST